MLKLPKWQEIKVSKDSKYTNYRNNTIHTHTHTHTHTYIYCVSFAIFYVKIWFFLFLKAIVWMYNGLAKICQMFLDIANKK